MSAINDGGPAFPVSTQSKSDTESGPYGHQDSANTWQFPGLTIRDYFAAKAMQALIPLYYTGLDFDLNERAYQTADNMLKARGAA